jgi:hypothetical protein
MFADLSGRIADNPAQWYTGIAVVDLDGDGAYECVVASQGGRNLVLKWGGDAFYDVGVAPLTEDRAPSMGLAAGDADGDGREELYVGNAESAPDRLFAWRRGGWIDLLAPLTVRNQSSQSVLAFDRFGMGRYGFLVAHEGGPFRYFEVLSQDRVEDMAPLLGLARIAGGRSLLSDGTRIYAGNEGIANMLFEPGSGVRFEEKAAVLGLADSAGSARGLAWLDANFDGRLDIVCADRSAAQRLFVRGSQGMFQDVELDGPGAVRSVVVADFDNDGREEIFLQCQGEANRLFAFRDGGWRRVDCGAAAEPDGFGVGAAAADWNGDGFLELMLGHGESVPQPMSLYSVPPNGNHWLRVAPLTAAGAPARGANVRIEGQQRVVDCGSGYLCQGEPVAHFGLGRHAEVAWVEVRWPDGTVARVVEPDVDQVLRIPYPG